MSGRPFTGKEAAQWGLFTEAVPDDQLEATVHAYIEKYSHGPTTAYAQIKEMINRAQYGNYADGMSAEICCQSLCEQTEDYREAVIAFLDKRSPEFRGK